MHGRGISGIPVLDAHNEIAGVVTRADLIELGVFHTGRMQTNPTTRSQRLASHVMTRPPRVITSSASIRDAARIMSDHGIHRVFVSDGAGLVGVVSALDVTAAVSDARIEVPLSSVTRFPLIAIDVHAPLSEAVALLARIPAVIVTEDARPVGVFTRLDALASRSVARGTPVEVVFDAGVICMPADTKLHRAAAQAVELDARRIIAIRDLDPVGLICCLDFVRVAADDLDLS
jgi:CBS domain-containing protein